MMRPRKIPERKKKYGWLVLATVVSWLMVVSIWLFVDPINVRDLGIPGSYLLFVLLAGLAVFLLSTIVLLSVKRALWWTSGLIAFFYLRIYGLGSLLNAFLLVGVMICGELYVRFEAKRYKSLLDPE